MLPRRSLRRQDQDNSTTNITIVSVVLEYIPSEEEEEKIKLEALRQELRHEI